MMMEPVKQSLAIQATQRHDGQFELEAASMAQQAVDEYLPRVAQTDAFGRFVERAGEHQSPEALDCASRLSMLAQPIGERRVRFAGHHPQAGEAPNDAHLFSEGQIMSSAEG